MIIIWLKFAVCAAIILYAGSRLSKYGDIIAEKSGMGRVWVGVVLLATVTSLPELANNISSIVYVKIPDLAFGDLFGSCLFNILIIAILDIFYGHSRILSKANASNVISAVFGIILICSAIAGIGISHMQPAFSVFGIGFYSIIILFIYLLAQRLIYFFEKNKANLQSAGSQYLQISSARTISKFFIFSLLVIAAGSWLPQIGKEISQSTGWGNTFVGTILLGAATSLPEIVVSFSAIRIGAIDMAIGNLLGSNIFNMGIIFADDIFYVNGPILADVSLVHIFTGLFAIALTAVVIAGLFVRSSRKIFKRFSWDAIIILLIYLLSIGVLFNLGI